MSDGTYGKVIDTFTSFWIPEAGNVERVMDYFLPKLKPVELKDAIIQYNRLITENLTEAEKNKILMRVDPVIALFQAFDVNKHSGVRKFIKKVHKNGKSWWDFIELYLRDTSKMVTQLGRSDIKIRELLSTKEAKPYIEFIAQRTYDFFYYWTWFHPRRHRLENGKITYRKIKLPDLPVSIYGYVCKTCGMIWSEEQMKEEYQTSKDTYLYISKKKKKR